MDKAGANFFTALNSITEKLSASLLVCQLPIGAENDLRGIIDLVAKKAYYFRLGDIEENYQLGEIPTDYAKEIKYYREKLIEKLVEAEVERMTEENREESLILKKYEKNEELSEEEIKKLLRQATLTSKYFPVFCGSAFKNVGVKLLLNGIVSYLPSPQDTAAVKVFSPQENTATELEKNSNLPLALAFKIIEKANNQLTFFRVYSGKILANSYVYNVNRRKKERISRLVRMHADKIEEIKQVEVGDIAAAFGLRQTVTGDTLGSEDNPLLLENIEFDNPVISLAIEAKTNKDNDKLSEALKKLVIQDPGLKHQIDKKTGQILLSGRGELHLEVSVKRLREHGVEVSTGQPKISYFETITKKLENVEGEYKKQTGGSGHFARVKLTFEPNKDKGFEFVDAKKGQEMSNKDAEEVKEGLEEAMSSGLLLNYPLIDMKATLLEGKRHMVDTKPGDFKNAAILAFRGDGVVEKEKRKQELGVVLLEPIMELEVATPEDCYGKVLNDVVSRKGVINKVEKNEKDLVIHAHVPLANLLNYNAELLDFTSGEGVFDMELSHYQKVPSETLNRITEK
jgi:elongation factor G